jgi:hypothetical protein
MSRVRIRPALVAVTLLAVASPARSQEPTAARLAAGVALAGRTEGTFLAPTLSRSFGSGLIQGRLATSLAWNALPSQVQFACPSIRGIVCDTRALGLTASSTVAIEIGAPRRDVVGGFFVAAHGGIGAMRWRSGGREDRTGAVDSYRDYRGRTSAALVSGFGAGVDLPIGARPVRVQVGSETFHERWDSRHSVAAGVVLRW